jgi:hypothetical protein
MPSIDTATTIIDRPSPDYAVDPAHLAAAAFLARYSGRTLDAYRQDLRGYFNWAVSVGLPALEATRPHIELYRGWLEERGLAASTIDRRLSTVCGFYRFAHIDGRVAANPAQYVRRPQVHPSDARGLDRSELGRFLFAAERYDHNHSALAVLLGLNGLRVSEACAITSKTSGSSAGTALCASWERATSRPPSRWCLGRRGPSTWPSGSAVKVRSCAAETASASTGAPLTNGSVQSASVPALGWCTPTC